MQLYTRRLFGGSITPGLFALSTVPVGELWVIKDCRVEQLGGEGYAAIYVFDGTNYMPVVVNYPPTGSGFFFGEDLYTVAEEGDVLLAEGDDFGLSIIISGYRFILP